MSIRQDIYSKLTQRASQLFGKQPEEFSESTRFVEDCNAKSTQYSQITTFLEDEFDTEIPFMSFRRQATFGEAVDFVLTECLGEEPEAPSQETAAPAAPAAAAPATGLRREILDKLIERASGLFGKPAQELSEATRFVEDCNAKSTQYSQITTFLEDEFDTEIPFMSFRRQATFGEAVNYVLTECLGEELDAQEEAAPAPAPAAAPAPAPAAAPAAAAPAGGSAKSDHDDELAMRERFTLKETFKGEELEAVYMVARKPVAVDPSVDLAASDDPMARMGQGFCPAFNQRVYECAPGILCEQDVGVKMRDGVTIYCDIYRPKDESQKYPAIVSWSWFGKRPGEGMSEWQIMGVPPHTVSKFAKFESPDPMYWVYQGYAVANVDVRGAGHSEGNVHMFTHQDREDGYDFIEWLAVQHWCNGNVGMSGNSGVAMHQWGVASMQPPHLKCIAPWECSTDLYRESFYEGGVPALSFNKFISAQVTGTGGVDSQVDMAIKYPFMNGYWEDKRPDFSKVTCAVYQTAGFSHFHLRGSMQAFRKAKTKLKWLRAHRDFEWPDTYQPENLEDLKRFYDRYLKDIHNGWEMTPHVRLDIMDAYDCDYQVRRPENEFPLKRTEYKRYYFDASDPQHLTMKDAPVTVESSVAYDGNTEQVEFDMTFEEDTELTGYMYLHLYVAAESYNDMDMFVNIQKADENGNWLPWSVLNEPHPGAWGKCRISRRELDPKECQKVKGLMIQPVMAHKRDLKVQPGEIVPVDIEIVPSARIWHKGQKLRVQIAGRYIREGWFEPLAWDTDNHGRQIIYTGGQYESFIQVPVIPPKYRAGDYVYR